MIRKDVASVSVNLTPSFVNVSTVSLLTAGVLEFLRRATVRAKDRFPRLRGPIQRFENSYDRWKFFLIGSRNARRQDERLAPVKPFGIYWIDASAVSFYGGADFILDAGWILPGDWDLEPVRFDDLPLYRAFVDRYVKGQPWKETYLYRSGRTALEGGSHTHCASVEGLERWLERFDDLQETMTEDGYRTQQELLSEGADPTGTTALRGLFPAPARSVAVHEIAVSIGRDGHFHLDDGRHRLSIAKILDIEIAVRIVRRHAKWQAFRERIATRLDQASDNELDPDEARRLIREEYGDELEGVFLGLKHPDLDVLFEDRFDQ